MAERIELSISRAAALALAHWLSIVPGADLPVTHPSERQGVADLLTELELAGERIDANELKLSAYF